MFADAYYRYWENKDFANNCRIAYKLAQQRNWQNKNWDLFQQLTNEMLDLELMGEEDFENLRSYMVNWLNHYRRTKPQTEFSAMASYWHDVFPEDSFLKSIE